MHVFQANDSEIKEILFVINETNKKYYKSIITPEYYKDPVLTENDFKNLIEKMTFFTYKIKDKIVGVAAFEPKTDELAEMHWVYVLSEYQRRGVGKSLVQHIETEAKKMNFKVLRLPTSEQAHWARDFYLKLGYEVIERRQLPEDNVIILQKRL
jgi:putative acetyltransferase